MTTKRNSELEAIKAFCEAKGLKYEVGPYEPNNGCTPVVIEGKVKVWSVIDDLLDAFDEGRLIETPADEVLGEMKTLDDILPFLK